MKYKAFAREQAQLALSHARFAATLEEKAHWLLMADAWKNRLATLERRDDNPSGDDRQIFRERLLN